MLLWFLVLNYIINEGVTHLSVNALERLKILFGVTPFS
jgi:hypothetical protein